MCCVLLPFDYKVLRSLQTLAIDQRICQGEQAKIYLHRTTVFSLDEGANIIYDPGITHDDV